jgi:alpha-glucoside transport system substrate-binding protein
MALAATAAARGLTPEECRTYLHREACPAPRAAPGATVPGVHTAAGIVPVERLASETLAGTLVDVVSQLPADLAPLTSAFERATGIDVAAQSSADADLQARVASGQLPDAAIVARPMTVAELARAGVLVDLAGIVDVETLRATAGAYLVSLETVGDDGAWPAGEGRMYGATFAAEVASLVWYPKAAFERAGYAVPRTWDDLTALAERIVADGGTPWCLGVGTSRARTRAAGASAADFVEELVLQGSGVDAYERWTSGGYAFQATPVRDAFLTFGSVAFAAGSVRGGASSAIRTPEDLAAWPMFTEPPGCWLHMAGGTIRGSWPAGAAGALAAFPFPVVDPEHAGAVRGRAYAVVVFHDRPEVRRFVDALLGDAFVSPRATAFVAAGLRSVGLGAATPTNDATEPDGHLLLSALRSGSFRVAASDLMPAKVAEAFAQGTVSYLAGGPLSLNGVLGEIQHSSLDVR